MISDNVIALIFLYGMLSGLSHLFVNVWFTKTVIVVDNTSYWKWEQKVQKPRYYISFPKMCSLTIVGQVFKWLVIYPVYLIFNLLWLPFAIITLFNLGVLYILRFSAEVLIELSKVYRDMFKYCMCKKFKAEDIYCLKW